MDGGGFSVQEFMEAITSQLDRTQDAMRLKALNRPLTYAIKDFAMEMKAFVDMAPGGDVLLRPATGDAQGASVLRIGFTTMTRPMIEENTVPLQTAKSPSLEEMGFDAGERRNLERIGVRNAAELENLNRKAGDSGMARVARIPMEKLSERLGSLKPRLDRVEPVTPKSPAAGPKPVRKKPPVQPVPVLPPAPGIGIKPVPRNPSGPRLRLKGANLMGEDSMTLAVLDGIPLAVAQASEDELIFDLPEGRAGGLLELTLPDGEVRSFALAQEADPGGAADPWLPSEEIRP